MTKITKEQARSIVETYGIKTLEDAHYAVKDLMKDILQTTLEAEIEGTLGRKKYDRNEESTGNHRNGSYEKKVRSTFGEIDLIVLLEWFKTVS